MTLRTLQADLPAHATVLSMRSPVLKAMLQTGMRESATRVIDLQVEEHVAKSFMAFLYADDLDTAAENFPDLCCHLLKLAHRFEVLGLVNRCAKELENVSDVRSPRIRWAGELDFRSF